jgi:hypothetical protein
METEFLDGTIPFLDVFVIRKGSSLSTKVYRKPTHTGRYLNYESNHPPHVKRGIVQSLHSRASIIWQERQDLFNEIKNMRRDLKLSGYQQRFIESVLKSGGSCRPEEEERKKPLGLVFIPNVKGISEKFKRIGNRYNIRTVFKTKHTLRSSLMRTTQYPL